MYSKKAIDYYLCHIDSRNRILLKKKHKITTEKLNRFLRRINISIKEK